MRRLLASVTAVVLLSWGASAYAGDLKLTMQNGRVTLIAQDVPLRQILDEWSRVGKTEIVNADKLTGPSMTLHMIDVPERQVLDILFKAATGYLVTPRLTADAGLSQYHKILVMVPSGPPAATTAGNRPVVNAPNGGLSNPMPGMNMPNSNGEDENPNLNPAFGTPAGARPPETMFNYANPLQLQQQQQQMAQPDPGGMAVPGMTAGVPGAAGAGAAGGATRPGVVVQPPAPVNNFRNPYGLPSGVQPGSATPPPGQQPDRSKYSNPGGPPPGN